MIDISKHSVTLNCPECKRSFSVQIKQIAQEELVTCTCGKQIQLRDKDGSAKKSIRDINSSFKKFEDTIKRIGK
jgi:transcription elongation factor Elf1